MRCEDVDPSRTPKSIHNCGSTLDVLEENVRSEGSAESLDDITTCSVENDNNAYDCPVTNATSMEISGELIGKENLSDTLNAKVSLIKRSDEITEVFPIDKFDDCVE
eukprot:12598999-Ditylum_brightwellii.AAC.1